MCVGKSASVQVSLQELLQKQRDWPMNIETIEIC